MQVLWRKLLVTGLESVDLKAEGNTFLSTFLPRSELSADAVNLRWKRRVTPGPTHIQGISPENCYLSVTCQPLITATSHPQPVSILEA